MKEEKKYQQREFEGIFLASRWIARLMSGLMIWEDTAALDRWVRKREGHKAWFEAVIQDRTISNKLNVFREISAGTRSAYMETCEKAGIRYAMRRQGIRRRSLVAALILLPLFAGLCWKWMHKPERKGKLGSDIQLGKDIGPGGNRATLLLADGSSIVLDRAANGLLVNQGNALVTKEDAGNLVYKNGLNAKSVNEPGEKERSGPEAYNTMITPIGGTFLVTLSDGTKVWLNSGSSLRYPVNFENNRRTVSLTGEGYFEVSPRAKAPFVVMINDSTRILVLGTDFNVQSYTDEPAIQATLVQGLIKVTRNRNEQVLKPGEQGIVGAGQSIVVRSVDDVEEVIAWKEGMFRFDHADLKTILKQVSRWYGVSVVYEAEPPRTSIRGEAPRNVNLSKLLEGLSTMISGVHFDIREKQIVVRK